MIFPLHIYVYMGFSQLVEMFVFELKTILCPFTKINKTTNRTLLKILKTSSKKKHSEREIK